MDQKCPKVAQTCPILFCPTLKNDDEHGLDRAQKCRISAFSEFFSKAKASPDKEYLDWGKLGPAEFWAADLEKSRKGRAGVSTVVKQTAFIAADNI